MVLWHLRPGYLADSEHPTERAKFRYFRDAGREALSVLLLSLADQRATKGPLTTNVARRFAEHQENNGAGAKYLRGRRPLMLVFQKKLGSRSLALGVESKVKKLSKARKEELIRTKKHIEVIIKQVGS